MKRMLAWLISVSMVFSMSGMTALASGIEEVEEKEAVIEEVMEDVPQGEAREGIELESESESELESRAGDESENEPETTGKPTVEDAIVDIGDMVYSGTTLTEPQVTVSIEGAVLARDLDYELSFGTIPQNPGDIGSVTVTGIGQYEGVQEQSYAVMPPAPVFTAAAGTNGGEIILTLSEESKAVPQISGYQIVYELTEGDETENMDPQAITFTDGSAVLSNLEEGRTYSLILSAVADSQDALGEPVKLISEESQVVECLAKLSDVYNLEKAVIELGEVFYHKEAAAVIYPSVNVKMNSVDLKEGVDYSVTFTGDAKMPGDIGTAMVTPAPGSLYQNLKSRDYRIELEAPEYTPGWGDDAGSITVDINGTVDGADFYKVVCRNLAAEGETGAVVAEKEIPASAEVLSCEFTGLTPEMTYEIAVSACYKKVDESIISSDWAEVQYAAKSNEANNLKNAGILVPSGVTLAADISGVIPKGIRVELGGKVLIINQDYTVEVKTPATLETVGTLLFKGDGSTYVGEKEMPYEAELAIPEFMANEGDHGGEIKLTLTNPSYGAGSYDMVYGPANAEDDSQNVEVDNIFKDSDTYVITGLEDGVEYAISLEAVYQWGTDPVKEKRSEKAETESYAKYSEAYNIAKATVELGDVYYSAAQTLFRPTVTVKMGEHELDKVTDYEVKFLTDAALPGDTGTVEIIGKLPYNGTVSRSYKLLLATPDFGLGWGEAAGSLKVAITTKTDGADAYQVELRDPSIEDPTASLLETKTIAASETALGCEFTGRVPGKEYQVLVKACYTRNGSETVYSEETEKLEKAKAEDPNDLKYATIDIEGTVTYAEDISTAIPSGITVSCNGNTLAAGIGYEVSVAQSATLETSGKLLFKGLAPYTGTQEVDYQAVLETPAFTAAAGEQAGEIKLTLTGKSYGADTYRMTYIAADADESTLKTENVFGNNVTEYVISGLADNVEYTISVEAVYRAQTGEDICSEKVETTCEPKLSNAYNIALAKVELTDVIYSAAVYRPGITSVTLAGKTLTNGVDYEVSYDNPAPEKPGDKSTVIVTAKEGSDYTGSCRIEYTVKLDSPEIEAYTGNVAGSIGIKVTKTVYGASGYNVLCQDSSENTVLQKDITLDEAVNGYEIKEGLVADADYTVTVYAYYTGSDGQVKSETAAGSCKAKSEDINNLKDATITVSSDVIYAPDYEKKVPDTISVTYGGNALVLGTDYTVKVQTAATPENDWMGTLLLEGKGAYHGEQTVSYDLALAAPVFSATSLAAGNITLTLDTPTYGATAYEMFCELPEAGSEEETPVTIFTGAAAGATYTIENLQPGKQYAITLRAVWTSGDNEKNSEDATKECYVKVADATNIVNATIVVDAYVEYRVLDKEDPDDVLEPMIDVSMSGTALERGVDYTATVSKVTSPGQKGTCTITGIGKYKGTKTYYFIVTLAAPEIHAITGVEEKNSIKVSIVNPVPGASGYKIKLYSSEWSPEDSQEVPQEKILSSVNSSVTFTGLIPGQPYQVVACGYYGTARTEGLTCDAVTVNASTEDISNLRNATIELSEVYYAGKDTPAKLDRCIVKMGDTVLKKDVDYQIEMSDVRQIGGEVTIKIVSVAGGRYTGEQMCETKYVSLRPSTVTYKKGTNPGELFITFTQVPGATDYYVGCSGETTNLEWFDIVLDDPENPNSAIHFTNPTFTNGNYTFALHTATKAKGYPLLAGKEYPVTVKAYPGDVYADYSSYSEDPEEVNSAAKGYSVIFKNWDGKTLKTEEVAYGDTPEGLEDDPVRPATLQYVYEFSDWNSDPYVEIYGNKVFTAVFERELRPYTITFDKNGGKLNGVSSIEVEYGTTYENGDDEIPTCGRKGYLFLGWYTAKSGGSKISIKTKCTGNRKVYARWQKLKVSGTKITKINSKKKGELYLKWKKVSNASGYQIRYSLKSNMKSAKTTTAKKITTTVRKLKKGKKYYVQIRAYRLDSTKAKVYGSWCGKKSVTIKK